MVLASAARSQENLTSSAVKGEPSCHLAVLTRWKVKTVPSGLRSHDRASWGRILPAPSSRTSPSYRLSRKHKAIDAVASAVGSSAVGSWTIPSVTFVFACGAWGACPAFGAAEGEPQAATNSTAKLCNACRRVVRTTREKYHR